MPRSPIPQMIEDFHQMSLEQQRCFLDLVDPQPEPEPVKSQKKPAKKSASKSSGKSARASGMAAQLNKSLQPQREDGACAYRLESGAVCNTGDNNPIHDQSFGYAGYHEFQPATDAARAAAGE